MAGDEDEVLIDEGTPNEGLEAEAVADGQDGDEEVGGLDAEGAAEGDGADAQEGQVDQAERRPSRGEVRFQKLSQTAKQATEDAALARREATELRERIARLERPAQAAPQGPSAEQIALMTPDELIDHKLGLASKRFDDPLDRGAIRRGAACRKQLFQAVQRQRPAGCQQRGLDYML